VSDAPHSAPPAAPLKKTPLNAAHRALGAKMVDFGGWDMPVQYAGVIEEHVACRTAAGLFDVSHMGELEVRGALALDLVQRLTPNDAAKLIPGRVQYSALTTPEGTFVDDILVYCRGIADYLLVVNASNIEKDFAWLRQHEIEGAKVDNASARTAQIAVQGPRALDIVQRLVPDADLASVGYYHFVMATVAGHPGALVSRTGYTGEDGFEVYLPAERAPELWNRLLEAGEKDGIKPCGLGARDTLRLEAKLALYGNDIDATTTVIEAGLGWVVRPAKGEFLGREVLARQKSQGPPRLLVGFEMIDRGIARHGYPARIDGQPTGTVTSGSHSPSLGKSIGLVYLPAGKTAPGTEFEVEIRGKAARARVVRTPFVPHRTLGAKKA
jgi:aminomethyltransferase